MKKTPLKQIGKKGREWQRERKKRLKELEATGEYRIVDNTVFGKCKDCSEYHLLTPDHKVRRSQGGGHEASNLDWICIPCHRIRDQQGDPMNKKTDGKPKKKSKAPMCKHCGYPTHYMMVCQNCGKLVDDKRTKKDD